MDKKHSKNLTLLLFTAIRVALGGSGPYTTQLQQNIYMR